MDYIRYEENEVQRIIGQLRRVTQDLGEERGNLQRLERDMNGLSYLRSYGSDVKRARGKLEKILNYGESTTKALQNVAGRMNDAEKNILKAFEGTDGKGAADKVMPISAFIKASIPEFVFNKIKELLESIRRRFEEEKKNRIKAGNEQQVYDGNGLYGGNQSNALENEAEYDGYRMLIKKNTGRRLSDAELRKYLEGMESEGCGYMSVTNRILKQYEGRAEDFERDFGFPMYNRRTGDLNYDMLMVDFYSSTDNWSNGKYDRYQDYDPKTDGFIWFYDYYTDTTRNGSNIDNLPERTEKYLSEHGVQSEHHTYGRNELTVDNYEEIAKKGEINIHMGQPYYIRNADGTLKKFRVKQKDGSYTIQDHSDAGHSVAVTGVETIMIDGVPTKVFKVSSWGEVYYVNPADAHGRMNFSQFEIKH